MFVVRGGADAAGTAGVAPAAGEDTDADAATGVEEVAEEVAAAVEAAT